MKLFKILRVFLIVIAIWGLVSTNLPSFAIQEEPEDAYLFNKKNIEQNDILSLQDCVSIAFL